MERLGSQQNIRRAKLEIVQGLREGAPLLLNGDDPLLWGYENPALKVIFYGIENKDCQITAKDLIVLMGSTTFTICYQGEKYPAHIPCMGQHNVLNALAAFGVGVCLGMEPVSYTHLGQTRAYCHSGKIAGACGPGKRNHDHRRIQPGRNPVSYTHLLFY